MKRILIFSLAYFPFVGGAEIAIKEITDRIGDAEFDLLTVNLNGREKEFEKIGNINVYRLGKGKKDKYLFPFLAFKKAEALHQEKKYDLIWGMMANQASWAALRFKKKFPDVKYFLTLQEGDSLFDIWLRTFLIRPLYKRIYRRADFIQPISNYLAKRAVRLGALAPLEVVPNGVACEKFRIKNLELRIEIRNKLNLNNSDKIVITISRLVKKNGIGDLIKAMALLPEEFKLIICGSGQDEKELKNLTNKLNLDKRVVFLGQVPHAELPSYLWASDVFCRPSLSEGLGNVFLEAMAAGVPVVATPVGGIPDFLIDNKTGLFCQTGNPKSIAEKINQLSRESELREQIIKNGLELVKEKYEWDNIARRMNEIFAEAIGWHDKIFLATGIFPPDIGGPATYTETLLKELPKRGYETRVVTYSDVVTDWQNIIYRIARQQNVLFRCFKYFYQVWKLIPQVDIIYAQGPMSEGLPVCLAAWLRRRQFILKIVGDYAWEQGVQRFGVKENLDDFQNRRYSWRVELMRIIERLVARWAKLVITPSEYLKNIIKTWKVKEKNIKVIYNSVENIEKSNLTREELKKKLDLEGDIILSASRLVPWKGFGLLIEIMPELLKVNPNFKLLIAGSGPEEKNLESKIKRLGLMSSIKLLGRVEQKLLWQYIQAAEMFVLNTSYEGLSHLIVEAMQLGTPIITTAVGGNPELITNNETGILIDYNNSEQIRKAIMKLNQDKNFSRQLGERAKEVSGSKFNRATMISELIKLL